jgi:hypothetical protein
MNSELTREQQTAVDGATAAPARVREPGSDRVHVLLASKDYDWIRGFLPDLPDAPRRLDPRSNTLYALVPVDCYERFKAFFEDDPITREEQKALLRDLGKRAGWDDPEMDIYDELYGGQS